MISYAGGCFGKHLKNRQIPYQSARGPLRIDHEMKAQCLEFKLVPNLAVYDR